MKQVIIKGSSPNAIISSFRKEYNVKDWELQYEITSQGSKGLFGLFGKKTATVRFNLLTTEERIVLFIEQLLKHMDIKYVKITTETEQKTVYVTVHNSSDAGFLIGKNGNMLEQLQYLINRVFENAPDLERIYLDTEEYRLRQEQTFLRNYVSLINRVKTTGKSVTLEPMPASERRIIHKYVEGDKSLKTLTVGDGDNKRIVVMPAAQNTRETAPRNPDLTPQQHAQQSYQRHNKAHPGTSTSPRPPRSQKPRPPRPPKP